MTYIHFSLFVRNSSDQSTVGTGSKMKFTKKNKSKLSSEAEPGAQTEPTVRRSNMSDSFETVKNSRKLQVDPRINLIKSLDAAKAVTVRYASFTGLRICQAFHSPWLRILDLQVLCLRTQRRRTLKSAGVGPIAPSLAN